MGKLREFFQAMPASSFLFFGKLSLFSQPAKPVSSKAHLFHKRYHLRPGLGPSQKVLFFPIQASNRLHLIFLQAPCKKAPAYFDAGALCKNQKTKNSPYLHLLEAQRKAGKAAIDLAKLGGIHQNHRISQIPHRLFHHRKTFGDDHLSIDI